MNETIFNKLDEKKELINKSEDESLNLYSVNLDENDNKELKDNVLSNKIALEILKNDKTCNKCNLPNGCHILQSDDNKHEKLCPSKYIYLNRHWDNINGFLFMHKCDNIDNYGLWNNENYELIIMSSSSCKIYNNENYVTVSNLNDYKIYIKVDDNNSKNPSLLYHIDSDYFTQV